MRTGAAKGLEAAESAGIRARPRRALVAFGDSVRPFWLRLLSRGFRHCLVAIEDGGRWVVCNPLSHWTEIAVLPAQAERNVAAHLVRAGYLVVPARACVPDPKPQAWRPYTCVEAVKRILGLRAPWIVTPRQLFRRLIGD